MLTAIWIYLAIVVAHGWYRACVDAAEKGRISFVELIEERERTMELQGMQMISNLELRNANSAKLVYQIGVRAAAHAIQDVLQQVLNHMTIEEYRDDYTDAVGYRARVRVVPGRRATEAGRDSRQDDQGRLSPLFHCSVFADTRDTLLRSMDQREGGRE